MRSYIFTRAIKWHVHGDDGMGGTVDYDQYAIAADDDSLMVTYQAYNDDAIATYPGYAFTFTADDPITIYVLLDKESVLKILNIEGGNPAALPFTMPARVYDNAVNIAPEYQYIRTMANPPESPRDTWHGNEGLPTHVARICFDESLIS